MRNFTIDRSDTRTNKTKRWLGLLTFCMALLIGQLSFAQLVQIGSGTSTTAGSSTTVPVTNYNFSYCQMIVTESQISDGGGSAGEISRIRFYTTSIGTASVWADNWTVFLGNTTKENFSSNTDWVSIGDLQQVFVGSFTPVANDWWEISFTTPFEYTGGNLIIAIDENTPGWLSAPTFRTFTSGSNTALLYRTDNDVNNPDPANPPMVDTGGLLARTGTLPQMQFYFVEACPTPMGQTVSSVTYNSVTLNWFADGDATTFDVEYGIAGFTPTGNPSAGASGVTNGFSLGGLTPSTTYSAYVRQNCEGEGDGLSNWGGPFSFTTTCLYPDVTDTTPGEVCGLGEVTLSATTTGDVLSWFSAATGGTKLGEGETFITAEISETTSYYVEAGNITTGIDKQVGTGTATSTSGGYSPYYHGWGGVKTQFIYRANDLIAAGFAAGEMNSLAFDVTATGSALSNFTVHIGHTSQTMATSTHISVDSNTSNPLTLVYSNASQSTTIGWNTYAFTEPFVWDGVSNIVVQTCYSNFNGGGTSASVRYHSPGATLGTYTYADNKTAIQILNTMTGAVSDGATTSGNTLTSTNRANILINGTAVCASPRTEVVATVTDAPEFTLSAASSTICNGDTSDVVTIATGAADYDTFVWEPATGVSGDETMGWTLNPTETTTYTLTVSQSEGTCSTSTVHTVTVNPVPTMLVESQTIEICSTGDPVALNSGGTVTISFGTDLESPGSATLFPAEITGIPEGMPIASAQLVLTDVTAVNGSWRSEIRVALSGAHTLDATQISTAASSGAVTPNPRVIDIPGFIATSGTINLILSESYNDGGDDVIDATFGSVELIINYGTYGAEVTWSPIDGLFTDAEGTVAYMGEAASTVYAKPASSATYTATASNSFDCIDEQTVEVTVLGNTPTGFALQVVPSGSTVADLVVAGENLTWYADEELTTVLEDTTELVEGSTYYVISTEDECVSNALAITVAFEDENANACEVVVELYFEEYGDVTTWQVTDADGDVVASGGPYFDYDFTVTDNFMASNPPYSLEITIDDVEGEWCDNVVNYSVTVGGSEDISGTMYPECSDIITDTIEIGLCPTCVAPNGLAAITTATGADLTWTGTALAYDIEWGTVGFTSGAGTTITGVTTTTYTLTASTGAYQYYVRQDCGSGDISTWAGPYVFVVGGYDGGDIPTQNNFNPSVTSTDFCTPEATITIDVPEGMQIASLQVFYSMTATTDDINGTFSDAYMSEQRSFIYSPTLGMGESALAQGVGGYAGTHHYNRTLTFANEATGSVDFVLRAWRTWAGVTGCNTLVNYVNNGSWVIVPTFQPVPPCTTPTALTATPGDNNEVDLTWTSTGELFDIEYGPNGFTLGSGTTVTGITASPYTLALPAAGSYQFYVRQDCENNLSGWAGPFSFVIGAYTGGDIPTQYNTSATVASTDFCTPEPTITIEVPEGMQIAELHVQYSMTAQNVAYMSEQRSFIYSPTLEMGETTLAEGEGLGGTYNYSRSLGDLGYGATGSVDFVLRAWRTWGNTAPNDACNTYYNKVNNGTWVITPTFEVIPTCPKPMALEASTTGFNEAILSWTSAGTTFDIEYGVAGFTPTGTPSIEGVSNPYTLSGLVAETNYQYYVRQDCGDGDLSIWAGPFSFYTGYCTPTTTWTNSYMINGFSTSDGYTNISNLNNGTTNAYNNFSAMAVTQSEGGTFNYLITTPGYTNVRVWLDLNQDLVFDEEGELLATYEYDTSGAVGNFEGSLTIPPGTPEGDYRIRVRSVYYFYNETTPCGNVNYGETEDYTLSVVPVPSCMPPSALSATSLSLNTAELAWFSDGSLFDIEFGVAGFTPTGEPSISGVASPYILTTPTSGAYQYYVRQDCGDDDTSLWVGPFGFVVGAYNDGDIPTRYNTGPSISSTDYCTPDPIITIEVPDGMQIASLHVSYKMTAAGGAWMSEQRSFIYSPSLGMGETALAAGSGSTAGTMNYSRSMNFANGAIGTVEFALRAWRTFGNTSPNDGCSTFYNKVDNDTWVITPTFEPLPPCPKPLALAADVTGFNEAILSWMSTGSSFDIEYGVTGFTPTGEPSEGLTEVSNNYALSGLEAETTYQYYVRQTCGEDGTSDWAGPFSFFTGYCTASSTNTGYRINGFSTTNGYTNILNENNGVANSYNNYSNMNVSQSPGGTFDYSISVPGYTVVEIWIDLDQDLNFDPDMEILASFETYGTGNTVFTGNLMIPIGTPEGDYRMRVRSRYYFQTTPTPCGPMQYGETEDYTISVVPTPTCLPPTALTLGVVTFTSANISWSSDGDLFDVEFGPTGFTPTGTASTGYEGLTTTSTTLTDLTADTHYQFYVRQDCGDDDTSLWAGPFSFYTGYCAVTSTSTTYGISNFTTTGGITNISNPSGPGSYSNYSTQVVSQFEGGVPVNFTITSANGTAGMGIWIDWNNNMTFNDPGEQVYLSNAYVNPGVGTITVPAGTPVGNYRMRVVSNWLTSTPIPCGDLGNIAYGEAEDYTFAVIEQPTCMPPVSLAVDGVTFTSANISWSSSGTLFDVEWGLQGFTPTGTPTTGFAGITGTSVSLTDLTPETYYQYYVRQDCGDDDLSLWTGPFTFYTGYCVVTSTNTTYGISNFTTTGGITNISNPSGPGSYSNYSTQVVSQFEGGAPVNFTITSVTGTIGMGIWIDWNNDMDFSDDGEQVYNSQGYYNPGTGTINIPAGTPVGNYRMRVVGNWLTGTPTPCGNLGNAAYGEAEDYTFAVIEQPTCMPPSNLTASTTIDSATLSWTSTGTLFDVEYGNLGFTLGTGTPLNGISNSYTINNLAPGTIQYYVRQDCGDGDVSLWAGPYTFIVGSYTGGDIPTLEEDNPTAASEACLPAATITIDVPAGYELSGLTVQYNMTAQNGAWMSEQRSALYSPTLTQGEATVATGTGNNAGTQAYNRSVTFANGATGSVEFVLKAWRTWSSDGEECSTYNNYVVNGTWVLTPTFSALPCDAVTPTGAATQSLTLGETLADLDVTGTNLVWYADATLTTELPDTTVAVNGTNYYVVSEINDDCQSDALAITVTVIDPCASIVAPTGASNQSLLLGQTIAGLSVSGTNLVWYADATLTTVISNTTLAVNGTTYYVVSETDDCQSDALAITVTVIDPCAEITMPTGDAIQTVAEGTTLAELEVNGTSLAWYSDAALTQSLAPNTVVEHGVIYYVASVTDICQSEPLAITVYLEGTDPCEGVTVPTPTGEATQTVDEGTTLANLIVEGENLQWYADADLTEALEDTHVAEDNTTYYVTQTIGLCTSEALAVNVLFTVGRTDFETFAFRFYPNPVGDVLNLTSNSEISQINLFNMLGQKVTVVANANNTQVDMSGLPTGNYIISVTIEGVTKTFKVVKN